LNEPRRSLKKYEITNLLFFLVLMIALGVLVFFVFRYYGNGGRTSEEDSAPGIVSEAVSEGTNVGIFYLGTRLTETTHQYQSRLQISATDDGLIRDLFSLPGVEEITLNPTTLLIKKNGSVRWESIQSGVRTIVGNHLHQHF
jgi:hypothetical protein